jgi:hypothetical protein
MPMDATKVSHVEFSTSKAAIFGASMNSTHIPETKTKTTHLRGTATTCNDQPTSCQLGMVNR